MEYLWTNSPVKQKPQEASVMALPCPQNAAAVKCHNHCPSTTSLRPRGTSGSHLVTEICTPLHVWCVQQCQETSRVVFEVKSPVTRDARCPTCSLVTDQCCELDCGQNAGRCVDSSRDQHNASCALYSCDSSQHTLTTAVN